MVPQLESAGAPARAEAHISASLPAAAPGVVFVDWPWGCIGPAWLDTVLITVNVIVYGGDGDQLLTGADTRLATDVIAGLTGFFLDIGRLPAPPGLPTVRTFQRAQGNALLPWLHARMTG